MKTRLPQIIELLDAAIQADNALCMQGKPGMPEQIRQKVDLAYTEALEEQRRQSMEVF